MTQPKNVGELKKSGWVSRPVKEEMRQNAVALISAGEPLFDGVVGYETLGCHIALDDEHLPVSTGNDGTPSDHTIVAMCPSSNLGVGDYPKSISALSDQGDLEFIAERIHGEVNEANKRRVRHGNAVIVETRPFGANGGTVITVGTTDWSFGLGTDRAVEQVTHNALGRLGVSA